MKRLKTDKDTEPVYLGVTIPRGLANMLEAHRKQRSAKFGFRLSKTDVVRGILVEALTAAPK